MTRSWFLAFLLVSSTARLCTPGAFGQAAAPPADKQAPPEEVVLPTKDGVQLAATYLPSSKGKDAVTIILLHMFEGNRHDVEGLGALLQQKGHAVIMPDLRGHGDSKTVTGLSRPLEAKTMPPNQFGLMVENDLETVKRFLVEKNNASQLNIEKLCIVAAEMSVPVAAAWTVRDWSWPVLPALKQGQDVKALVLLSPRGAFKTLNAAQACSNPKSPLRDKISILFVSGAEDVESTREAKRLYEQLQRVRPKPEKIEDATLFLEDTLKTKLEGTKLLGEPSLNVATLIDQFIELRLTKQLYPWRDRKQP